MRDKLGRDITYMRSSVTDRCTLRCRYCMPEEGVEYFPHEEILTFEEILRVVQGAVRIGIHTFRLTGGEPLARRGLGQLIQLLRREEGVERLLMTTNGVGLSQEAHPELLDGVNLSLDTLNREKYAYITRRDALPKALEGLKLAMALAGEVKINCVALEEFNREEIPAFAALAREKGLAVRFIEAMPLGPGRSWRPIPGRDVLAEVERAFPGLRRLEYHSDGPAEYYGWEGSRGKIGVIHPMSRKFCGGCNRVRLTARGRLQLCLAEETGLDLRAMLRRGASAEELSQAMARAIEKKPAGHHLETQGKGDGLSRIGG